MDYGFKSTAPGIKYEVSREYLGNTEGVWWDVEGEVFTIPINLKELGTKKLILYARIGKTGEERYFKDSYTVLLNGKAITMTWDESTAYSLPNVFGGAVIANLQADINYTQLDNEITVKAKRWGALIGYNDGQLGGVLETVPVSKYNADVSAAKEQGKAEGKKEQRELDVKESQAKYEVVSEKIYSPLE